ncbi:hypothetical protein [Christiangramia sp. SM2212]|uniref:Thrombospondin type 3 repeat-containing protein n=1 Tax=Christiangramia sediminicola TaxID=3073267 RepID=A0ABU1EQD5_9FLAO|nr:hypothetical protein [Christiangramia sp. SM2212]MDR5590611.1 hypothetical protein [Christiangramia sp. SM2212]
MKIFNRYIAFIAIVAMLFTSCSKDENNPSASDDPSASGTVELTFGALLNDLANRAASVNKDHFDQVPDCADSEPAVARIGFSYGGSDYEVDVDILSDETGYFTDYSEELKIPVANNSSVEVTLNSFMVYDGDPEVDGELIWIAPIAAFEGQFDGYVDNALPFSFDVSDGTKPYIDVEVLCFDRRMVNEYGYVFFDLMPEVIYPLCLFVNYCDENGRHYVADYSVDLFYATGEDRVQLYDHTTAAAMATTGEYSEGEYYADPLCLVVPGPVPNLSDDAPYLYLVIYPEDWDGTGDIDNSPIGEIPISWEMVDGLLNGDGTTNEYWHLLIGECEGALTGDGSGGGGTGDNDLDDDGVTNDIDKCPNTPAGAIVNAVGCPDTDGDGIYDNEDGCPNENPTTDVDGDGCEDENGSGPVACLPEPNTSLSCTTASFTGDVSSNLPLDLMLGSTTIGTMTVEIVSGNIEVGVALLVAEGYVIDDVEISIGDEIQCYDETDFPGTGLYTLDGSSDFSYTLTDLSIRINVCPSE